MAIVTSRKRECLTFVEGAWLIVLLLLVAIFASPIAAARLSGARADAASDGGQGRTRTTAAAPVGSDQVVSTGDLPAPQLVKDINPGNTSSAPELFVRFDRDRVLPRERWRARRRTVENRRNVRRHESRCGPVSRPFQWSARKSCRGRRQPLFSRVHGTDGIEGVQERRDARRHTVARRYVSRSAGRSFRPAVTGRVHDLRSIGPLRGDRPGTRLRALEHRRYRHRHGARERHPSGTAVVGPGRAPAACGQSLLCRRRLVHQQPRRNGHVQPRTVRHRRHRVRHVPADRYQSWPAAVHSDPSHALRPAVPVQGQ